MKRTLLLIIFLAVLCMGTSFSQDPGGSMPMSFQLHLQQRLNPIELPPLDLYQIKLEDIVNDRDKSLPWRYGVSRPVRIDLHRDAVITTLPNGDKIFRMGIRSPHAVNISVVFDNFYLPAGSRLQLYNTDGSDISRPYSSENNRANQLFGSWFITGDTIWIEYYQPAYVTDEAKLEIGSVIHGYRIGAVTQFVEGNRGLNDSGACNYDVNCSVGADFDSKKELLKKAVALLNLGNGYLCSAVLVNNAERDKTPYVLTGNHCLENSDPALWSIRFNWMSPAPVCGTGGNSIDVVTNFTISGAELKANNALSDFALVELVNPIPDTWDVVFAGWDNSDAPPSFEVGIHHPNGDIMKICRDDSGAVKDNASGTEVWLIKGASVGNGDGWELGTTESGSSGSPLFDQNGHIIGQLYAGQSFCDGTSNNGEYDIYGRFAVSWDGSGAPENSLYTWLDPLDTGLVTLETMQNNLSVNDVQFEGELSVYPNPAIDQITVMNSRYPNLVYRFYSVTGQLLQEGTLSSTMNMISVTTFKKGIYFLHLVDSDSNAEITKKILVNR